MPPIFFPIFFIFLILIIALAIWGFTQAAKRKKELAAWAQSRGFNFNPGPDRGMEARYGGFSCLRQGENRYAYNLMRGVQDGRSVCAFDYHYETHSTDSKGNRQTHHHHFSSVITETGLELKKLFIRPEGFLDRVAEFFGFDDIDFESAEFSRKFCVKAPDRRWAFDVIHQETMEFLLNSPRYSLDFFGSEVIAYRNGTFKPAEFEEAMGVAAGVLDRLPRSLTAVDSQ